MDDNLRREPNDDPALSHRQGSQVFQSKIPKNQPIKNKFWSDPLKKGKKLWSEQLKKEKKLWSESLKTKQSSCTGKK